MRTSIRRLAVIGTAALLLAALASQAQVFARSSKPTALHFGTPVRLPTYLSCGGYEPGIAIDKFGNIFVTAHKQNHCLALAPDPMAPAGVRAQSWLWTSSDGVNFSEMPGLANLPADPDTFDDGHEGDIAL